MASRYWSKQFLTYLVIVTVISSFVSLPLLFSQPFRPRFEHINAQQGLPNGTILSILKDQKGFMWFATQGGIARYDGISFKTFQFTPSRASALDENLVFAMMQDSKGTFWIGTVGGGLIQFNPVTEQFRMYKHDTNNDFSIRHNEVYSVFEDHSNRLWVGTKSGLEKFDLDASTFTSCGPYSVDLSLSKYQQVTALYQRHNDIDTLWIGTWGRGLALYRPSVNSWIHFPLKSDEIYDNASNFIWFIRSHPNDSNLLLIGTNGGGLFSFSISTQTFQRRYVNTDSAAKLLSSTVRSMMIDHNGTLWFGAGGLTAVSPSGHIEHYVHVPNDTRSLINNNIISLYHDETHVGWIGTRNGINRFYPADATMQLLQNNPYDTNSLSNNFVYSLVEDEQKNIWISTDNGLNRFQPETGRFRRYLANPQNPYALQSKNIRYIYIDRSKTFWIGTTNGYLHRFNPSSGKVEFIRLLNSKNDSFSTIFSIIEDSQQKLWVGTSMGLFLVDWNSRSAIFADIDPSVNSVLRDASITCLYEDVEGVLWIGTRSDGLIAYDRRRSSTKRFVNDSSSPGSLSSNFITHIHDSRDGRLWITTGSGGFNAFDRSNNTFTHFTTQDGFLDDFLFGFLEDEHGNFWISSHKGISRFNPHTGKIRNFSQQHLDQTEFNRHAFLQSSNGTMYFGGINGINYFRPSKISDNRHIPPIAITKIEVHNKELNLDSSAVYCSTILLDHVQNSISFEFASLDYFDPQQNKYAYKLEGVDKDWVYSHHRRYAAYPNLDPGTYRFLVKGSNNDGVWNEKGASVTVIITPPWWNSTWAYTGYAVVFFVLLFTARKYELNRQKHIHLAEMEHREAENLKEINELKTRFFANISHEFRTPLTLIEGPLQQLRTGTFAGNIQEAYEMMLRNTRRLQRLVNQLLDLSKLESHGMIVRAQHGDLVSTIKSIAASFESAAARKRIRFQILINEASLPSWYDNDVVEKVLVNLLSNAFKFTPEDGTVTLSMKVAERSRHASLIELSVADTGIGIPAEFQEKIFDRFFQVDSSHTREQEGTSIGLSLVKELVELHRGTVTVVSIPEKGSLFTVRLPLNIENSNVGLHSMVSHETTNNFEQPDKLLDDAKEDSKHPDMVSHIAAEEIGHRDMRSRNSVDESGYQETIINDTSDSARDCLLIIEDNDDMRKYIRSVINGRYTIIEAVNGSEGITKALDAIPDIIISDVMMPKMDGFEVCKKIKSDHRTSHIPVILLTAKAGQDHKLEGLETGADEYLVKPFDAKELFLRLYNILEQRKKQREHLQRELTKFPKAENLLSSDDRFLNKVFDILGQQYSNPDFDIASFAEATAMSRMQLHRKIKALTGYAPGELLRHFRLKRAAELLKYRTGNISEIAYQVGFNNLSHFAGQFHEKYGVNPSEYDGTKSQ